MVRLILDDIDTANYVPYLRPHSWKTVSLSFIFGIYLRWPNIGSPGGLGRVDIRC